MYSYWKNCTVTDNSVHCTVHDNNEQLLDLSVWSHSPLVPLVWVDRALVTPKALPHLLHGVEVLERVGQYLPDTLILRHDCHLKHKTIMRNKHKCKS